MRKKIETPHTKQTKYVAHEKVKEVQNANMHVCIISAMQRNDVRHGAGWYVVKRERFVCSVHSRRVRWNFSAFCSSTHTHTHPELLPIAMQARHGTNKQRIEMGINAVVTLNNKSNNNSRSSRSARHCNAEKGYGGYGTHRICEQLNSI